MVPVAVMRTEPFDFGLFPGTVGQLHTAAAKPVAADTFLIRHGR